MILAAAIALSLLVGVTAASTQPRVGRAQSQDTEQTTSETEETETPEEVNQEQPEPQIPNAVGSVYNEQMTPEEVEAECQAGKERITAEFERLTENIEAYETSHPEYYAGEKGKLDAWLTETTAKHDEECENQKEVAEKRQLPPSPEPETIPANYHEQMTPEEVEVECEDVDRRIVAEYDRLLASIAEFETSHPEYYAAEKGKLDAWRQLVREEQRAECERQREAALERQPPPTPIDDLFPQIPGEIKGLAARLGLTDEAKTILYNNEPELFDDADDPDYTCDDNSLGEEVYVYGCWDHRGSIKLLRDNSTAITLAHELLHAVYYDFYVSYRNRDLDAWVNTAAAGDPEQTRIILAAYAEQIEGLSPRAGRYVKNTELHSFVGTQYANIPPELEEHYARYFKNRQVVLDIFNDWLEDTRAKLAERRKYNQQLLYQAGEYQKCLQDPYATAAACQPYLPDESQYLDYDKCLSSNKTFLTDCRDDRPAAAVDYAPLPAPPETEPVNEPDDADERAAEELISRTNQRQQETEESFINQLAEHDHDLETTDPTPVETPEDDEEAGTAEDEGESDTSEEDEPEGEDGRRPGETSGTSPGNGDDGPAGDQQTAGNKTAVAPLLLLFVLAPLAAAGSFTITLLIMKRRPAGRLGRIQRRAGSADAPAKQDDQTGDNENRSED